ncbi:uncharacterized protein LOC134291970 [Aedes albopictus]|uniref:Reverse transcriptase zinc-binding domain-containing protein n=1 Tax=Aedes albopictus TaxID=7160 RepID=A0ABM1YYP2_AEDAL
MRELTRRESGSWTGIARFVMVGQKTRRVNFHLTQILSGHDCFRKYLHRFGHAESPLCPPCPNEEETPEHVVFNCPRFMAERSEMQASSVGNLNANNIITEMCQNEVTWNVVNRTVVADHVIAAAKMAGSSEDG